LAFGDIELRRAGRPKFLILSGLAAMLLLAEQILAAGHLHEFRAPSIQAGSFASAEPATERNAPGVPSGEHDEENCALCWMQAAAAKLLVPDSDSLAVRTVHAALPLPLHAPQLGLTPAAAFQPRAPPSAPQIIES
jgi:hypothetical protein